MENRWRRTSWRTRGLARARKREDAAEQTVQLGGILGFAFPYGGASPAEFAKLRCVQSVPLDIAFELGRPVFDVGRWRRRPAAAMPVPEAAVNEYRSPPARKHDIGSAGQISTVEPKPKSQCVRRLANGNFGLRVLRSDPRHRPGPKGWIAFPRPGRRSDRAFAGPYVGPFCPCSPRCSAMDCHCSFA